MWRRVLNTIVAPLLFASLSALATILFVEQAATGEKQNEAKVEAEAEVVEEVKKAPSPNIVISKFDHIFKEVAAQHDLDWLLLAAIARTESMFKPDAVSPAGATGLMQIMPLVAKQLGYTREQLLDVRTNVELAAQVLNGSEKMLRMPKWLNEKEKMRFTLASYNAGAGRIADARALARHFDSNAYKWNDVSIFLIKLSDPEYATHKVVKHGKFSGSKETISYVNKVMQTYSQYQDGITDIKLD